MRHIIRYVVGKVTIASENIDTGEITVSKKVEETKGVTFRKEDFYSAVDGSNTRAEPASDGEPMLIAYKYYIPELIDVTDYDRATGCKIFYKKEQHAIIDGYRKCFHCGKWIAPYRRSYAYNKQGMISTLHFCSEECLQHHGLISCYDCHRVFPSFNWQDNGRIIENPYFDNGNKHFICNRCYSNRFSRCQSCGHEFANNQLNRARNGNYYCDNCYREIRSLEEDRKINSYHTAKDNRRWKFFKSSKDNDGVDYIGAELEVEAKNFTPEDVAFECRKILNKTSLGVMAHFEHDGSLNNGVEIIFNPMTINFIYENENLLKNAFDKVATMARSHDTNTCGLHIHYSRGKFNRENISNLVILFEKFREELIIFARRNESHYAKFYEWYDIINQKFRLSENYMRENIDYSGDRYRAVNLRNSDTIEIRIFKGTLKFSTYMASVELVNNFMQLALNMDSSKIEEIKFTDVVNYLPTKYLIPYCEERGIFQVENTDDKEENAISVKTNNDIRTTSYYIESRTPITPTDRDLIDGGGDVNCVLPF